MSKPNWRCEKCGGFNHNSNSKCQDCMSWKEDVNHSQKYRKSELNEGERE